MYSKIKADVIPLCHLTLEDVQSFIKWVWTLRKKNDFDMRVISHPRTVMFKASDESGPIAFVPAQPVLMFESLAPKPGLTNRQTAVSLSRINEVAESVMKDVGMLEAFFITNDEPEVKLCTARGWKVILHDPEKGQWLVKKQIELPEYPISTPDSGATPNE